MADFKVISLDMFQTLVNVNSRTEHIWRPILLDRFKAETARQYAEMLQEHLHIHWNAPTTPGVFNLMSDVYGRSFASLFGKLGINYDVSSAVDILFREHTLSEMYPETASFLEDMGRKYRLCVVSDADEAMMPGFCSSYEIPVFMSELHRSYKNDADNAMFKKVLETFQVAPGEVLHIGDSPSDVLGAKREGISACWLNRLGRTWDHDVQPDYTVKSLDELNILLTHTYG
ncbi:hypothetical protein PSTEL_13840 [Paenibacillus stellifer]|uniref:Haloacid dehalogenase n=1 Tax=Paenibacillus stellifer TaxID=169760 RepID=A0A089N5J1_9BACL|nr:HAD family hydrolase [Paenibacillus stellifer]AIQ64009.1 hypothetical protein PSTEL_13840 [Paenibacillus stellifer]